MVKRQAGRAVACSPLGFDELVALGNLALVEIALRYEPGRGTTLSDFARQGVYGAMINATADVYRQARARSRPEAVLALMSEFGRRAETEGGIEAEMEVRRRDGLAAAAAEAAAALEGVDGVVVRENVLAEREMDEVAKEVGVSRATAWRVRRRGLERLRGKLR